MQHETKKKNERLLAEVSAETRCEDADLREKIDSISRILEGMTSLDRKRNEWLRSGKLANSNVSGNEALNFVLGEPSSPHRESYRE